MNRIATSIKNRLSLRSPQTDSLGILAELADTLSLQKNADLAAELEKVKSLYPTCADFERNFPSLCFALATGVGKTRLMGAFIAYLLDDLVVLMDESHHYRADRGMEVINELNPILGLELTATPQVERGGGAVKFKLYWSSPRIRSMPAS